MEWCFTILVTFTLHRFACKNNGVLFENDLLQIGVKSEFRQNLGRIALYFGNKTSFALQVLNFVYFPSLFFKPRDFILKGFSSSVGTPGDLAAKLILQVKPVDVTVDAGAQIQQLVNVECVDEFLGIFHF